jgi:ribonuclease VapC
VTTVLDTSALATVVLGEADAEAFLSIMLGDIGELVVSAANRVEAGIVVEARQGPEAGHDLHVLLTRLSIEVTPVDADQAQAALAGWRRFGKGRHPAGLNFGDCFAYALAKVSAAPLLYKGDDFRQTDVLSAI